MNNNIISTPHVVRINKDRRLILTLDTIKFLKEVIKTGRTNVYKYLEEHKNDKNRNTPILSPPISTSFVSSTKNAPYVTYCCILTNCESAPSIIDDSVIYYRMSYYEDIQVNSREVWMNKGIKQINIKQPSMLTGNIFFKNVLRTFFEDNPDGTLTKICDKIKEEHTAAGLDNPFFVGPNVVACGTYKYHCYYTEMSDQNQPFMFNAIGLLRDYNDDDDDDFSLLYSKSCIGFNANNITASFEGERHIRTLMGELKSKRTDTSKRYNGIVKHYTRTLSPKPTEEETNNPKAFEEEESMEENKVVTNSTSPSENKEPHDPDDLYPYVSDIISVFDQLAIFGMDNGFDETVLESITKMKEQLEQKPEVFCAFCKEIFELVKKENMKAESTNKIIKER